MKLSLKERADHLEQIGGCSVCTSPSHGQADCNSSWQKCGVALSGDSKCQSRHIRVLHGAGTPFVINNVEVNNVQNSEMEVDADSLPVLLLIQRILLRGKYHTSVLYDPGSNTSLLSRALAKLLNLPRRRVGCWITVATKDSEYVETNQYKLSLPIVVNGKQSMRKLTLFEVPGEITSAPQAVDVSAAYRLFPDVPAGSLDRPTERVGLLLGLDAADLMPTGGDPQLAGRCDNLLCLWTVLGGPGIVLGGSHPSIISTDARFTPEVNSYKAAKLVEPIKEVTVNTISVSRTNDHHRETSQKNENPLQAKAEVRSIAKVSQPRTMSSAGHKPSIITQNHTLGNSSLRHAYDISLLLDTIDMGISDV